MMFNNLFNSLKIVKVDEIQESLLKKSVEQINRDLLSSGGASFYTSGLTQESIDMVLISCVNSGYQVYKQDGKPSIGISEYKIVLKDEGWSYYKNVTHEVLSKMHGVN